MSNDSEGRLHVKTRTGQPKMESLPFKQRKIKYTGEMEKGILPREVCTTLGLFKTFLA